MATQRTAYRAPKFYDLPQIRRAAARTPVTYERDLEAEMRLKQSLVESIAELEKTKSEIRKATMDEFTQQRVAAMKGWADLYQAAAAAAGASAQAKKGYADFANSLNKTLNDERGKLAAGTPDAAFAETFKKDVLDTTYAGLLTKFTNAKSEQADLLNEIRAQGISGASAGQYSQAFEDMASVLEMNLSSFVMKVANQINSQSNTAQFAPNVSYMLDAGGSTIASAVDAALGADIDPATKKAMTDRLYASYYQSVENMVNSRDPNTWQKFAQSQVQARGEIDQINAQMQKYFSVGVPAEIRNNATAAMKAISDEMTSGNPVIAMQMAQERLAKSGVMPPGADADPAAQQAYKQAVAQELGQLTSPETFARQMAKMEVSPEIDAQIAFLKGELGKVGEVPEDPLTQATTALRSAVGNEAFDAWQKFSGARTAEEAALAATKDPGKFAVFKQAAASEPMVLERPRAFRKVVNERAAAEAAKTTAEAKQAAADYVHIGTTPDQITVEPAEQEAAQQEQEAPAPPVKAADELAPEDQLPFKQTPGDIQIEPAAEPTARAEAQAATIAAAPEVQQRIQQQLAAQYATTLAPPKPTVAPMGTPGTYMGALARSARARTG